MPVKNIPTIRLALGVNDDHIPTVLADAPGIQHTGVAASGIDLLDLLERSPADVVLFDADAQELGGSVVAERIKAKHPRTRVVVLTAATELAAIRPLLDLGMDGYLVKGPGRDELLLAIREAHTGRPHFSGAFTLALLKHQQTTDRGRDAVKDLSEREIEVLSALAEGLNNRAIGEKLSISPRTVETHRTNVMRKLDAHNVAALVRLAVHAGLVK